MKNTYSVAQINNYIKNMFTQDFLLHQVSVKGEVSNCKYHSSGHIYFTLKDGGSCLSAVMFAGNRKGLKFPMKDGDQVVVDGSIEVYERDGKYQIYARNIELGGAGDLYQRYEALKQELEEMGMFDSSFKKPIPTYAQKIGVVTAATGAAIQDIRNISHRRNPYVQLILVPAQVQGQGAVASIINGIHALEQMEVDIIIVGRGGGSIEDLWAFNEEALARAIFECPIPIISAVGHETDTTIADYVADMRAPTPSAAAELAVFDIRQVESYLQESQEHMQQLMKRKLQFERQKLSAYQLKLRILSPRSRLNENQKRLADLEMKLADLLDKCLKDRKHRLALAISRLEACSPTRKLSQGYAYVQNLQGQGIHSIKEISQASQIQLTLKDGQAKAQILEVTVNE